MTTAVLLAIVALLLVERAWNQRAWTVERRRLLNSALARNATEQRIMDAEPPKAKREPDPDGEMAGFNGQIGL